MKALLVAIIMIMTVFAVMIYLLGFPVLQSGVSSANSSASVNVSNYEGWTASVNAIPYAAFFFILLTGGMLIYKVKKAR